MEKEKGPEEEYTEHPREEINLDDSDKEEEDLEEEEEENKYPGFIEHNYYDYDDPVKDENVGGKEGNDEEGKLDWLFSII